MNIKFDWDDILIKPILSDIDSRSQISVMNEDGKLPLYVSPMDSVVDENNAKNYLDLGFEVCLPRNVKFEDNKSLVDCFFAYGLDEIISIINMNGILPNKVLIDIANGHLVKLHNTVKKFKEMYPNSKLMVGNIANPETFRSLSEAGADIIRVGIGNGGGCLTTQNVGVGYPMASLISECYFIKNSEGISTEILADGGFQKYSDVIKSLACGSDAVMLGSILNKAIESCGDNYFKKIKISQGLALKMYKRGYKITKKFRGMSTKEVQRKWNKSVLKTSEGVVRYHKVEYTLNGWCENFIDYLKSAMSYSACLKIDDFIGKAELIQITSKSFKRFDK